MNASTASDALPFTAPASSTRFSTRHLPTVARLLLLLNRFVPLALVVLAPLGVTIVAFHVFLAPPGLGITVVIVGLQLYLVWNHHCVYRLLPTARATAG